MKYARTGTVWTSEPCLRRVVAVGRTLPLGSNVPAVEVTLPPSTESPSRARRLVESALASDPTELVDVVTLLVSEAVTNAVLHAGTEVRVRIGHDGASVRVEVADASPVASVVRHNSDAATTGRGMMLIDQLADNWGQHRSADGKVIWFELSAPAVAAV